MRRPVQIHPVRLDELQTAATGRCVVSFWGHRNTLKQGEEFCGLALGPLTERPVIRLQENHLPQLNGQTFSECWILSPDYVDSFRPAVNEVAAEQIVGWQILKISWEKQ